MILQFRHFTETFSDQGSVRAKVYEVMTPNTPEGYEIYSRDLGQRQKKNSETIAQTVKKCRVSSASEWSRSTSCVSKDRKSRVLFTVTTSKFK